MSHKRKPSTEKPVLTRQGRLNSAEQSPFRSFETPKRKESSVSNKSNNSSLFDLHAASAFLNEIQLPSLRPSSQLSKLETVHSANPSPDQSPTPKPIDSSSDSESSELDKMSKPGPSGLFQLEVEYEEAAELLYMCANNSLSTSFQTIDKARQAITKFLIKMSKMKNVPESMYEEVVDLLINLKTRNLRWTSLKFQLITLPKTTSNGEVIALQSQLSSCPELRPTGSNRQSTFGPSNWRPRGNQQNRNFGGSSSSSSFQQHRPPPNPNFNNQQH